MENYIKNLEQSTNDLLTIVKDFSIEKLSAKNSTEWSILEILEHIYITDKIIYSIVSKDSDKIAKTKEIIGQHKLENILVVQREKKLQTPDLLSPKGNFHNLSDFISAFTILRNTIKNDLLTYSLKIDNRIHNHFLLGEMTIKDWLNFILFHTERHLSQINERK